jgi:predicted DsbA family dithiol-disulfide isomerase
VPADVDPLPRLRIDVWSDVVCPWCHLGIAWLHDAIASFEHGDRVDVVYRSFQLDPHAPRRDEVPLVTRLARKYGTSEEQIEAGQARLRNLGAEAGIDFRFDRTARGNTLDAHRLLHLAADRGRQAELKQRLFEAYFTDGEPIGEPDTLRKAAADVGLDPAEVDATLAGERYLDEVAVDVDEAREIGITGVPFALVDQRLGVPGAQPPDLWAKILRRTWQDVVAAHQSPTASEAGAHPVTGSDDATDPAHEADQCGPDACELY